MGKIRWTQRMMVNAKLRAPVGIQLSSKETIALAEIYKEDARKIEENEREVSLAIDASSTLDLADSIEEARMAKSSAVSVFKRTKDPIKRREWARRVVVADTTTRSLLAMKKRMTATHDRLVMIKGDLELQLLEAEAKAQETLAYARAGKQLHLAGEKLIDARTRARSLKLEYRNLEVSMEGAESKIDKRDSEEILMEAERIANNVR